jgi:hypothetical protein
MVANDGQRNFAASTINYFNIDLEKGNKDLLKPQFGVLESNFKADILRGSIV